MEPFGSFAPGAAPRDRGEEFVLALETVSHEIHDPVAKLKYIRTSLNRYQALDRCVRALPFAPLRRQLYCWLSLEGLQHLMTETPLGGPAPVSLAARARLIASRAVAAGAVLLVAGGLAFAAHRLSRPATEAPALAAAGPAAVAEPLLPLPAGITPAAVWLVERGGSWEQYSNGLRIETSFALEGEPRRYRVFDEGRGLRAEALAAPAGILFHTSESDIWPLDSAFNENLRDSSQALLRYLKRNRTYHYLIDRFGRVFRVVGEEFKANHAGHSIWSRDGVVYLNLNHAFLGLCFESRWDGGRALPITQAQLAAGRSLTDYLRQRFELPEEMCVTHGLTSVNPKKHLIGHHMDWSRGFPFAAFGLPDQYAREAPSVALFGFGYDDDFLKVLGEPWDGVRRAERALAEEAARRGRSVEELRREKQALYDRWIVEQSRENPKDSSGRAEARAPGGPRTTASGG